MEGGGVNRRRGGLRREGKEGRLCLQEGGWRRK